MTQLRAEIEDFLYTEADLLDRWELDGWLALFTPDCTYTIPPTDRPDEDAERQAFLVHDDRFMLEQRVASLKTRSAHAEWPHSRTRRLITNVRASENRDLVRVAANFVIHRFRHHESATFVGSYDYDLLRAGTDLHIRHRRAILDLESLQAHGMLSIII